jgi:hypothetical protein
MRFIDLESHEAGGFASITRILNVMSIIELVGDGRVTCECTRHRGGIPSRRPHYEDGAGRYLRVQRELHARSIHGGSCPIRAILRHQHTDRLCRLSGAGNAHVLFSCVVRPRSSLSGAATCDPDPQSRFLPSRSCQPSRWSCGVDGDSGSPSVAVVISDLVMSTGAPFTRPS